MGEGENSKAKLVGSNGEMEGSDGWERIPYFYTTAGDIQAKPTRVSGGFDLLVITGKTIVWPSDYILHPVLFITGQTIVGPSDYILRLVLFLFLFRSRSRSSHRPIPARDIPNCSELLRL